jgi:sphingolipid 8-(E)-desaturase
MKDYIPLKVGIVNIATFYTMSRKDVVLVRRTIEGLIAEGRKIIIFDGRVLKVDAWLPYHPGGDKTILHMVGRDATDEITA